MEVRFDQIFDFQYRQAKKLENSSYLEDLTGLLAKVASSINDEKNYFFGNEYYLEHYKDEPNSDFERFIADFKNTFYNGSCEEINIIRGRAGVGKSLFFKKGIQRVIRKVEDHDDSYIYMGVDFKNIDNDNSIEYYEKWIYERLYWNAIDCIRILGEAIYKQFNDSFDKFGKTFKTPHTSFYPLKVFCENIFKKYGIPCIIVFDNIDLASVKTQMHVYSAVVNICNEFNAFMKNYHSPDCYRIYFAIRPETELRYNEGRLGEAINFPLPNILKISLAIMQKVLLEAAQEFDNVRKLPCHVTCVNVVDGEGKMETFESYKDVAEYFYKILNHYLGNIWNNNPHILERLGTSEDFHCNIVNYNVRTFLRFFADTISNGGFKPLTKEFNGKQGVKNYNVFDYIEMVIRGRWPVHPGNQHINGEGGNKAPIVYNIFDTSMYGKDQKDKIKHFMLNIRILQYFFLCGDNFEALYGDMRQALGDFFDDKYIYNATRKLIYVRLLYSFKDGDSVISSTQNWNDISITDTTQLELSPAGKFYLEQMICEFEYLYQMSLSSLIDSTYVNELKTAYVWEKEKTVLCFLKSMFQIIKINIDSYNFEELIPFKKIFYYIDDQRGSRPYRRMLDRFIIVMKNKVQRAARIDSNSIDKLNSILEEAMDLEKKVANYFISVLE